MERTNHTSVNYIRIVKQKLHGPNEKGNHNFKIVAIKLYRLFLMIYKTIFDLVNLNLFYLLSDHSRNINNNIETNWRIINHTSIKWTSDIKYSKCHQRKQLNSKSRLVHEKNFVLCTNVQTSIKWFLRVCFFVNGLIMLNKHIKIIYLFSSGIKIELEKEIQTKSASNLANY